MNPFVRTTTPEQGLAKAVGDLIEEQHRPKPFVIPVLQNDPEANDPTNMWMTTTGRLRSRYWNGSTWVYTDYPLRSDITAPPAVTPPPASPARPAQTKTYKTTWTATWSQTYKGDGSKRTDDKGERYLVYGNSGSDTFNGTQRSLVGFDYAAIASALASSTIKSVQLKMTNVHAYWNSGVNIYFGLHNVTSEPASWPASSSLLDRRSVHSKFGKPQTKTIELGISFGNRLRAGQAKGLAIEAPSSSRDYYGFAGGVGSGYTPPQLIITYAK